MALQLKLPLFLGLLLLPLQMRFSLTMAAPNCPLDFSEANFTLAASICSSKEERAKCCRYINALIAVSVARYASATGDLGVGSDTSEICLHTISDTLDLYGVTRNATAFCGLGTKIIVNYECLSLSTVDQMLRTPKFTVVSGSCKAPLSVDTDCRKCLNSGKSYLRNLIGIADNTTLSTCRDATFVALASQVDNASSIDIAGCFFGVRGLLSAPAAGSSSSPSSPPESPSPYIAAGPGQVSISTPKKENHHAYRLTLVPCLGIAIAAMAALMMGVLIILIRKKWKELEDSNDAKQEPFTAFHQPAKKFQDGPCSMFRKFSYKETKKATHNFSTVIGEGGSGTVYKAEFAGTMVAAVKRMNKVSERTEKFCREIELLARLHHRHLVALKGFCIRKRDRFLVYEYMTNGSLKDQIHGTGMTPLSWRTRIQIAIDVANALEYLHFYCNPPLFHRDIKSSNILLDENFVAKVADFGLAHASEDVSICFEPGNTDIRGTPGYMDPEYVITHELTEKSDVYSYGVVLLELVTGRLAIQDNKNLVEWSQPYLTSESRMTELLDSRIGECFEYDQLEALVAIITWCTQKEGRARPSIKQVLRLLYECMDPVHSGYEDGEDEDIEGGRGRMSRSKLSKGEGIFHSGGDGRCLGSSSSTTRSYCSRSFLLETGSPQSLSPLPFP